MDTSTTPAHHDQRERAERFRQWHQQPPILVLPNVWDAGSARLFERLGARALATTSSGVAATFGYADGEHVDRALLLPFIERIASVVACPLSVDIEAGFGATIEAKLETIRALIERGVVGINIEDTTKGESEHMVEVAAQVELIQAIRALGAEMGVPLIINARTDVYLSPAGDAAARLAEATRRLNAYREAGADCLFPIGASDAETIGALARAVAGPINILAGPHTPSVPELADLGVARVSVGGGLTRVALGTAQRAAAELLREGTFTAMARDALPSADFRHLFE